MPRYRLTIEPLTAFATPMKGDTLFGQLCWALRHAAGADTLAACLAGYGEGRPFLVVSDAQPHGFLPRPTLPAHLLGFDMADAANRKAAKRRLWLRESALSEPLEAWHQHLVESREAGAATHLEEQSHNTINRLTGTTGTGQFAPYSRAVNHYPPGTRLDVHVVLDERLVIATLERLMAHCGQQGFGKEATTGLGKFRVVNWEAQPEAMESRHWLTLGPSVPGDSAWVAEESFYSLHVRFGRHGDLAALSGQPYKNPVVMAQTGALLTRHEPAALAMVGKGLGGTGELSRALPQTVHQGYAPVVPVSVGASLDREVA
jgi:CRISPR-associated protein Csm4